MVEGAARTVADSDNGRLGGQLGGRESAQNTNRAQHFRITSRYVVATVTR